MHNVGELRLHWWSQIYVFLIDGNFIWHDYIWEYYFDKDFALLFPVIFTSKWKGKNSLLYVQG